MQTTAALESFTLAMALFPDVQAKAQAELDKVVGSERMPEYRDLEAMPYVRAVILETLRWMPSAPLGLPHSVITDDEYSGIHIPKGTMIVAVCSSPHLPLRMQLICRRDRISGDNVPAFHTTIRY